MFSDHRSSTDAVSMTGMHPPARFWAVDLHVHTPGSADVDPLTYGASAAEEVVAAALSAGLDAIAVTDHNTVRWCDLVAAAATATSLIVLPGIEISTTEGHLLAVWDEGTPLHLMEDVLVELGIPRVDQGRLDVATRGGFAEAAEAVHRSGGIAIAAHADRPKGLLQLTVAANVSKIILNPALAGVEIVDPEAAERVSSKTAGRREMACVRGSDVTIPGGNVHVLEGIGRRRTWVKASRPDLCGLKHALADPELRVRLEEPAEPEHMIIESVRVSGGFLDGQTFELSADLNCLLGGTGTGKSLLIEVIRFALDQQTDSSDFPQVRREVDSRLDHALSQNASVEVVLRRKWARCVVRRAYFGDQSPSPEMSGDTEHFVNPSGRVAIRAFSQSEVIEHARTRVGRMTLIDSGLDLEDLVAADLEVRSRLADNSRLIVGLRDGIREAELLLEQRPVVVERLTELGKLFNGDIVRQQAAWSRERTWFNSLTSADALVAPHIPQVMSFVHAVAVEANRDLYDRAATALSALEATLKSVDEKLQQAYAAAGRELAGIVAEWRERQQEFDAKLRAVVAEADVEGKGLETLRTRLTELQTNKVTLDDVATKLETTLRPGLRTAMEHRETIIEELVVLRKERRKRRETRIRLLNKLMSGVVRIKLDSESEDEDYGAQIAALAKGSRLRADVLQQLCAKSHPVKLIRSFLDDDAEGVSKVTGVESRHIQTLFEHVIERHQEEEFLGLQSLELLDGLSVEFRKRGEGEYEHIERLAHGQKCTAILIIALADGAEPLIIDQPEDALHAPWIEEYLVERLRGLRGSRQYVFATRSPGLVASADAEMIITLTSGATQGTIEASGSLERYDLNRHALYHLEGGPQPFRRRTTKLGPSMSAVVS
ncbi:MULTISPECIES: AAA family ATPase [unclassified Actinoplanes]|uniref:AAA family ATPase n=1 Tax=unclassified Actinoplanes TaxID=2626549 RepID=UPI00043A36B4|nr:MULTISPECIES: AAA family ATPase [unclassified Actinoplanes]